MEDFLYTVAAFIAVGLVPINIFTSYKLGQIARSKRGKLIPALQERYRTSVILTTASLLGALVGANRLGLVFLNFGLQGSPIPLFLIAIMIILISVPGILWLANFYTDGFDDDDSISSS